MNHLNLQEDEESTRRPLRLVRILGCFLSSFLTSRLQSEWPPIQSNPIKSKLNETKKKNQSESQMWLKREIPVISALRLSFGFTTFHLREICQQRKPEQSKSDSNESERASEGGRELYLWTLGFFILTRDDDSDFFFLFLRFYPCVLICCRFMYLPKDLYNLKEKNIEIRWCGQVDYYHVIYFESWPSVYSTVSRLDTCYCVW